MDDGDPSGDLAHAISEDAKAEVRAAGIICPACETNQADLPDGHWLTIYGDDLTTAAECTSSETGVVLDSPGELRAAMMTDFYQRVLRDALYGDGFMYEVTRDGEGNTVSVRGLSPADLDMRRNG